MLGLQSAELGCVAIAFAAQQLAKPPFALAGGNVRMKSSDIKVSKPRSEHLDPPPTHAADVEIDEVDICNPTHPLFGRRFRVHRRCNRPGSKHYVQVFYTEEILLRIPVSALTEPLEPPTKLSLASVADLVSTFRVATACPQPKPLSGPLSQKP